MAVTYLRLSGSREEPDKTIRALLEDNWNDSNTNSLTPEFQSAAEEPDSNVINDMEKHNLVTVDWIEDEKVEESNMEPNGDTIHHWKHILLIDVYAESMSDGLLFQDEINRILWENAPDNDTRLPKSDAADSEADYFEHSEITFGRIEPEGDIDDIPEWQGQLMIHYRKRKS